MSSDPPEILSGRLLLAGLELLEPTFYRTVLLLTNHGPGEGALGYVLNRPTGMTVEQLLPDVETEVLRPLPVFVGGPVSQEHLTFAALAWHPGDRRLEFHTHLSSEEAGNHFEEGFAVCAFVGYSGWSEGQLENELRENAWLVQEPVADLLRMEENDGRLWARLVRDVSPLHRLAADMPDDLSKN